jgi:hypothetical protein
VYQRFRGPCCLHHQGVDGGYNPEDSHLHTRRRENLNSLFIFCTALIVTDWKYPACPYNDRLRCTEMQHPKDLNVSAEWLIFLLHILDVPDTGYMD